MYLDDTCSYIHLRYIFGVYLDDTPIFFGVPFGHTYLHQCILVLPVPLLACCVIVVCDGYAFFTFSYIWYIIMIERFTNMAR